MATTFQWQLSSDGNKSFNGNQVPMATKSSNGNLVSMETKVPMATTFQWQLRSDGNKSFNGVLFRKPCC